MDQQTLFYILAAVLILIGLLGTILPALPGLPLIFGGMLLAAWANGFEAISGWTVAVLGVLTLFSFLIDFASTAFGAKRVGASRKAIIGAVLGTTLGLLFMPVGIVIGPFVGAIAGELLHLRKVDRAGLGQATKVGLGTWFGILLGGVLKLLLALTMIGLFVLAWYF